MRLVIERLISCLLNCALCSSSCSSPVKTMEVQPVRLDLTGDDTWSFSELCVLFGWLSSLVTCCIFLGMTCCHLCGRTSPRCPMGEIAMAGNPRARDISTQTILCTPPSTIGKRRERQMHEDCQPSSKEAETVYSTYKMKGNEAILRDMVVRALPVVENLDQRRRAANLTQNN